VAARLRRTNVASVSYLGKTGENYFYAMEFIEGETLQNLIRRYGRLEVRLAIVAAFQCYSMEEITYKRSRLVKHRVGGCDGGLVGGIYLDKIVFNWEKFLAWSERIGALT
jgi:hypothetical protein